MKAKWMNDLNKTFFVGNAKREVIDEHINEGAWRDCGGNGCGGELEQQPMRQYNTGLQHRQGLIWCVDVWCWGGH